MAQLVIRFIIDWTSNRPLPVGPIGLQFNRWLPDGDNDSLRLPTDDAAATIAVWCERRGYVNDGWIKYDEARREVDPAIIPRQARIDGGHLRGRMMLNDVSSDTYTVVEGDRQDDPLYISLGKRVVQRVFYPGINPLIRILRTHYGQYWLPEFDHWDSRKANLGAYCMQHRFAWSPDGTEPWKPFLPEKPVSYANAGIIGGPMDYVRESDWRLLQDLLDSGFPPSPAAEILGRAHGLVDSGEDKQALVEGVTALEVAVSEYVRSRIAGVQNTANMFGAFLNMPLPAKVIAVCSFSGVVTATDLDSALAAIEHRNEVVHEGKPFREAFKSKLPALLRTVAALIQGPQFRFARYTSSNFLELTRR